VQGLDDTLGHITVPADGGVPMLPLVETSLAAVGPTILPHLVTATSSLGRRHVPPSGAVFRHAYKDASGGFEGESLAALELGRCLRHQALSTQHVSVTTHTQGAMAHLAGGEQ
jgi:hypothetical protein